MALNLGPSYFSVYIPGAARTCTQLKEPSQLALAPVPLEGVPLRAGTGTGTDKMVVFLLRSTRAKAKIAPLLGVGTATELYLFLPYLGS